MSLSVLGVGPGIEPSSSEDVCEAEDCKLRRLPWRTKSAAAASTSAAPPPAATATTTVLLPSRAAPSRERPWNACTAPGTHTPASEVGESVGADVAVVGEAVGEAACMLPPQFDEV